MRRLGILGIKTAITIIVLEVCLRFYNPFPFRVHGDRIILPAHQTYTFDNRGASKLDQVTHHTKNSLGFRGPEPPRDLASRPSLLTIGGSTTEGLFLSDGKTWTDALARRLQAVWPTLWVNNAGLDGQSTFGHIVLLRHIVTALHPKVIVFLVGANDLGLQQSNAYDTALVPHRAAWRRAGTLLAERVEVVALAQNLVRMARAREQGFGHSQVDLRTATRLALDAPVMDAIVTQYDAAIPAYRERLHAIVSICRTNGIDPVLITQPALFGDTIDPTTGIALANVQVNGRGNGTLEWRLLERVNEATREVAGREGVLLVDLARELPKDSRYFYDFLHYTNEGAEQIGAIVARHLQPYLQARIW